MSASSRLMRRSTATPRRSCGPAGVVLHLLDYHLLRCHPAGLDQSLGALSGQRWLVTLPLDQRESGQHLDQFLLAGSRIIPVQVEHCLQARAADERGPLLGGKICQPRPCWRASTLRAFRRAWSRRLDVSLTCKRRSIRVAAQRSCQPPVALTPVRHRLERCNDSSILFNIVFFMDWYRLVISHGAERPLTDPCVTGRITREANVGV
jgi:hypothetical protein